MKLGDTGDNVKAMKVKINRFGYDLDTNNNYFGFKTDGVVRAFQVRYGLVVDGQVGPQTMARLDQGMGDEPKPPTNPIWLEYAKTFDSKKETDSKFNPWLSGFWKIVGLPNFKTIVGSSFAWCGLFVAVMLYNNGIPHLKSGAGARNWAKYGVDIDWKKDGIPRGAIVHINHKGNCSSGSSNHVGFADGDCTAQDLLKKGAKINIFGGNQSNTAKVSTFGAFEICEARWPETVAKPGPVTKSINCSGSGSSESTR